MDGKDINGIKIETKNLEESSKKIFREIKKLMLYLKGLKIYLTLN
jgi:hypothetical protein